MLPSIDMNGCAESGNEISKNVKEISDFMGFASFYMLFTVHTCNRCASGS